MPNARIHATLIALAILAPPGVLADCARDSRGEIYCGAGRCARTPDGRIFCSRFDDGGAQITRRGEIVCGRGECARAFDGTVHCSTATRGSVLKDSRGRVRCEGRCEPGSASLCESTVADRAPR